VIVMDFVGDDNISWCQEARNQWKKRKHNENTEIFDYFRYLLPEKFKVLDLGCNIGNWHAALVAAGGTYTGVDASHTAIDYARQRYPEGNFRLLNIGDLDYEEEFDLVFMNTVLQHINLENKKKYVPLIVRAIKKNGLFVFQEKCDVDTLTTFVKEGWIKFMEDRGLKFIKYKEDPINGFVFRKL